MKKIQIVVTEDMFKALSKKLLDEEMSKQQFLENQIKEYLGGEEMTKQDILDLEGTIVNEEQLTKVEESEFVTGFENNGYSGQYPNCIFYTVTLEDGEEIEIYSYY